MHAITLAESLTAVPKLGYSIEEAAVISGFSRATLYREMASGGLVPIPDGRRRVIARADLEALIARRRADAIRSVATE